LIVLFRFDKFTYSTKKYDKGKPAEKRGRKTRGAKAIKKAMPASFRYGPAVYGANEGVIVLKSIFKGKYYFHLFLHRYNMRLTNDALCDNLKAKLMAKASYHGKKATFLTTKFD